MSNIASFTVSQYGNVTTPRTTLLNMDLFSDVQAVGSTTYVMYGMRSNIVLVIINETFAAVQAKIAAKTPPAGAPLYVLTGGSTTYNQELVLDSANFLFAVAAPNPAQSLLQYYDAQSKNPTNYIIGGDLTYITGQIPSPAPGGIYGLAVSITTNPQTVTVPHDFGAAANYVTSGVVSDFFTSGAAFQGATNLSGTQTEVYTSVQPCEVYLTFTGI